MSAADINIKNQKANKKSRRRKKRRTADSSDSESSSSSDNESATMEVNEPAEEVNDSDVELSDSGAVNKSGVQEEVLNDATKDKLSNIHFTTTELTQRGSSSGEKRGNVDLKKVNEAIEVGNKNVKEIAAEQATPSSGKSKTALKNQYLGVMFESYGEDINKLRQAPDFTNKSLVLLANVLKEGSNMFDTDSLEAILDSK